MFSVMNVRHSVQGGLKWPLPMMPGKSPYREPPPVLAPHLTIQNPTEHVQTCLLRSINSWQVGGWHPTGMLSCSKLFSSGHFLMLVGKREKLSASKTRQPCAEANGRIRRLYGSHVLQCYNYTCLLHNQVRDIWFYISHKRRWKRQKLKAQEFVKICMKLEWRQKTLRPGKI